ncbi:MAG: hypothetical protein MIO87_03815 [Methanomassiliicoccales archaeon]|nr:hypothetical protein [Methanomassiliicoccales archaeon]
MMVKNKIIIGLVALFAISACMLLLGSTPGLIAGIQSIPFLDPHSIPFLDPHAISV